MEWVVLGVAGSVLFACGILYVLARHEVRECRKLLRAIKEHRNEINAARAAIALEAGRLDAKKRARDKARSRRRRGW